MDFPDSPSPAPRLRRSPARQALHERTNSHTNELPRSTIRLVENDDAKIYTTSPFPTFDSQLFPPPLQIRGRTHAPASPQVSRSHTPSATFRIPHAPTTPPLNAPAPRRNPSIKHYGSIANALDADRTNPPPSPATQERTEERYTPSSNLDVDRQLEMDEGSDGEHEYVQRPAQSSSRGDGSNTSRQHGATAAPTPAAGAMLPRTPATGVSLQTFASRASSNPTPSEQDTPMSTASVGSSGTVVRNRASQVATPAGYYRLFPPSSRQPGSVRSTRSNSDPLRPLSMEGGVSPPSPGSPGSPVSPLSPTDTDSPPRHGVYASRAHARSDTALELTPEDVRIPIIPQGARAGPSRPAVDEPFREDEEEEGREEVEPDRYFTIPRRPLPRRDPTRWTLALSTVVSESTEDRSSSGNGYSIVQPSVASRSVASSMGVEVSSFPMPAETARDRQRRLSDRARSSASPIRVVSPTEKDLPPLPENVQQLQQQYEQPVRPPSAHLRSENRSSSSRMSTGNKRESVMSYTTREFRDTIPAWAKSYYSNEARSRQTIGARPISSLRSPSLQGDDERRHTIGSPHRTGDMRVWRARPRAQDRETFYRDSMAITPLYDQPTYVEVRGSRLGNAGEHDWSPHLFYDRRSAMNRRTLFLEPSIDLSHEGKKATRRNVQVWCFVVGFVFPFAWLLAAFLPLPRQSKTPPSTPGFEQDLEKAYGPRDQARYENARWWRNINRMMSAVGVGIIIAVIVLVVVAATREGKLM